jgi:hypothetical protein
MSKLAVILSFGTIKRIPISGKEAEAIYQNFPGERNKLMLQVGHDFIFGRTVFVHVPRCIIFIWWQWIKMHTRGWKI